MGYGRVRMIGAESWLMMTRYTLEQMHRLSVDDVYTALVLCYGSLGRPVTTPEVLVMFNDLTGFSYSESWLRVRLIVLKLDERVDCVHVPGNYHWLIPGKLRL